LRWIKENIQRKCPDKWRNISWALHHDNAPAHMSLVVWQFLASMNMTIIPPPLIFPVPKDETEVQRAMFWQLWRYPERNRMWWRRWREMTFSNASNHGNPAGITVSMQKGLLRREWRQTEIR
jgi:hypothetical protein